MLRVLPVEVTCYASEEEITRAIKPLILHYFPVETQTAIKVLCGNLVSALFHYLGKCAFVPR